MPYGYSSESRLKLLQGYDVKSEEDEYGMVEGIQNVLSEDILLKYQKSVHVTHFLFRIIEISIRSIIKKQYLMRSISV